MFYQTERFFNLTSNKPCIHEVKCFIKMLVDDGLLYHFDDYARDCLSETGASDSLIDDIDQYVNNVVKDIQLNWRPHEDPQGYASFYASVLKKRNSAYERGFANA